MKERIGFFQRYFIDALGAMAQGLFASLPSLDSKERRLKPIKGLMPDPTVQQTGCVFCDRCPHAESSCRTEKPPVTEIEPGHFVKCSRVKEVS